MRHVFIPSYTLFCPFLRTRPFCACVSVHGRLQRGSISAHLYIPLNAPKSPHFIHIIILSIKVGHFLSLPTSSLFASPLFNLSPVWLSLLRGAANVLLCMCLRVCSDEEESGTKRWWRGGAERERARDRDGEGESNPRLSSELCLTHGKNSDRKFSFAAAPG